MLDAAITLSNLETPCPIDRPDEIARTDPRHLRMPFNLTGICHVRSHRFSANVAMAGTERQGA